MKMIRYLDLNGRETSLYRVQSDEAALRLDCGFYTFSHEPIVEKDDLNGEVFWGFFVEEPKLKHLFLKLQKIHPAKQHVHFLTF